VGQRIAIDSLGFTTVHSEIRLPIPIQIQSAKRDATSDWFLKDPRGYRPTMPLHLAGKTVIQRDQFHIALPSFAMPPAPSSASKHYFYVGPAAAAFHCNRTHVDFLLEFLRTEIRSF
jgi:hypothetical protein